MLLNLDELTPAQLDALKEVGNIGAGHGATALSQLLGKKINITVPKANVIPLSRVPGLVGDPNTLVAGLILSILGDATGKIILLFPRESALSLSDMLLKQPLGTTKILSEMGHSAIKEAGNILTGAYLSALNEFLGMLLLISVPTLVFDMAGALLGSVTQGMEESTKVICIETKFIDAHEVIGGYFILVPDSISLRAIFQAIKVR
ncbi:MAG TPA: chemotaxis protein CheC [bacterium]|nr:chemotaxis protein CheC [bacterium]